MSKPSTALVTRDNGNGAHSSNASRARARRLARWQAAFLQALRKSPNVTAACRRAKISRFTAYKFREDDESFASRWDEALDASVDEVEEKAFRIAKDGDNQMIQFVLKAFRGERYRERSEVAVAGGVIFLPAKAQGSE
jgi:hypothetical protein